MSEGGREKRNAKPSEKAVAAATVKEPPAKRPRGRPRKTPVEEQGGEEATGRKRKAPPVKTMKTRSASKPQEPDAQPRKKQKKSAAPTKTTYVEVSDDFVQEPTEDNIANTLAAGLADGTIIAEGDDDSDYEEEEDDDSLDSNLLAAVSSTPFVRKNAAPQGRKALGRIEIKVQVHDGVAMRNVVISSKDGLYELLEKIANAMKRPSNLVEMGYEAPWSSKAGQKRNLAYVSNDDELDDFWLAYSRYSKGKGAKDQGEMSIVFRNMMDSNPAAKSNGRSKEAQGSKAKANDPVANARNAAQELVVHSLEKVQDGMFCDGHNRLCYKTWDGKCKTYTPEFATEHAKLLARGEPGVVPNKVPDCISSKLLDYVRPGRKNRAASHSAALDATDDARRADTEATAPFEETRRATSASQDDFKGFTAHPFEETRRPTSSLRNESKGFKGPLNFPSIADWLKSCEEDLERGRDGHAYSALAMTFATNGCTRIDDIPRMTRDELKALAGEGMEFTVGLINRVFHYAVEDVAHVKLYGKLNHQSS